MPVVDQEQLIRYLMDRADPEGPVYARLAKLSRCCAEHVFLSRGDMAFLQHLVDILDGAPCSQWTSETRGCATHGGACRHPADPRVCPEYLPVDTATEFRVRDPLRAVRR